MIEDRQLGGPLNLQRDLANLLEIEAVAFVTGKVGECLSKCLLHVKRDFIRFLASFANFKTVIRAITHHKL